MYKRAIVVLMAVLAFAINAQAADGPANVVLLISDDQSWTDYGFMGHPHVQTPNLDRLAGAGLQALCSWSNRLNCTDHWCTWLASNQLFSTKRVT